jgi:hypothetical protein
MLITFLIRHINVYFLVVPAVSSLFFFFLFGWLYIAKKRNEFLKNAKIKYFFEIFHIKNSTKKFNFFQISIHGSGR